MVWHHKSMPIRPAPILLALLFFAATLTPAQAPNQPITAVTHIDFMPGHLDAVPGLPMRVASEWRKVCQPMSTVGVSNKPRQAQNSAKLP
jgi:hypothetical protein